MQDTKKPMFGHALNWGLISGLVMIAMSLIPYYLGISENKLVGLVVFAIYVVVLFFAQKTFRDSTPGERLTYGRALGLGLFIGVFVSVILAIFNYIFFKFIAPEYHATIIEQAQLRVIEMDLPAEAEEKALSSQAKFMTAGMMSVFSIFGTMFQTLIAALIASIFGKGISNPEELDTDTE